MNKKQMDKKRKEMEANPRIEYGTVDVLDEEDFHPKNVKILLEFMCPELIYREIEKRAKRFSTTKEDELNRMLREYFNIWE